MQSSLSIGFVLGTLFRRAKILILGTFAIAAAAALISIFLVPRSYLSSASLLPEEQEAVSPLAAILGQSGLPFLGMGGGGSAEINREILASYGVCRRVLERLDLYSHYDMEEAIAEDPAAAEQAAVNRLQESLSLEIDDRSGVLRLLVTAPAAELSREIALALVDELDRFNREQVQEGGRRKLQFLTGRQEQADRETAAARQAIQDFAEREGVVHLPAELEAELQLVAELNRQLVLKELERASLAMDAAGDSPALRRVDAEIGVLRDKLRGLEEGDENSSLRFKPLASLPALSLAYYQLRRDLEIQQEIGDLLLQQIEQARLQAENDVSTLRVLDAPRVPTLPVWPRKKIIVLGAAALGFLLLSLLVLWLEFLAAVRTNRDGLWANWQWLPGASRRSSS
jgi:uncharacterized protein involved in exopolysaccharide biosynthesis